VGRAMVNFQRPQSDQGEAIYAHIFGTHSFSTGTGDEPPASPSVVEDALRGSPASPVRLLQQSGTLRLLSSPST
jgi:hypothetical protein